MISRLTKQIGRRYSQFGSTPSIGARAIGTVGFTSAPPASETPERWFAAQTRGQTYQAKTPRDTYTAQTRGQTFASEVVR